MMAISIIAGHATIMKSLHSGTLVRSCRPKSAAGWPSGWIESAHLVASAWAWGAGHVRKATFAAACIRIQGNRLAVASCATRKVEIDITF